MALVEMTYHYKGIPSCRARKWVLLNKQCQRARTSEKEECPETEELQGI